MIIKSERRIVGERSRLVSDCGRGSLLRLRLRLGRPTSDHDAERKEERRHYQDGEQQHGGPSLVALKLRER